MNYQTLAKRCRDLGIELQHDREDECYRALAPAGHTIDGDLHEMLATYDWGGTKTEAMQDLYDRLEQPRPCDYDECGYCFDVAKGEA